MRTQILSVLISFYFLTPIYVNAQGNNMNIYNKILRQNTYSGQKRWRKEEAQGTMLDVDAIVRREEKERQRREEAVRRQNPPRRQVRCVEGSFLSDSGCGPMGIHQCWCVNGQPGVGKSY